MIQIIFTVIIGIIITKTAISRIPGDRLFKDKKIRRVTGVGTLILTPLMMLFMFDLPWDDPLLTMGKLHLFLNLVICGAIMLFFMMLFNKVHHGIYASLILAAGFGVSNAEVISFRFYPIAPVDILSVRTAAAVAGGYEVFSTIRIEATFALMFICMIITGIQKEFFKELEALLKEKRIKAARIPIAILILALFSLWVNRVDFFEKYKIVYYDWAPVETYKASGMPLTFTAQLHTMFPDMPKGYSGAKAGEIVAEGAGTYGTHQDITGGQSLSDGDTGSPVILVIMNESFTDFGMVGKLDANNEYLKFTRSLKDDPGTKEWGYTYTGTYGGGTYKSEFEYLTGCSMANISGTIPYMMFDFNNIDSIVSDYNKEGYRTVAAHPFFPTDWRRDKVYEGMGFDDFLDLSDFDTKGKSDSRGYLSDRGDYERMIEEIKKTDEPLFLFNVTMQNHGGYSESELPGVAVDVDGEYNGYEDFRIFAGDMKKSDEALSYLFTELKKLDRPVTCVLFGDHQPSLDTECLDILFNSERETASNDSEFAQRKYITPYFIWTNDKTPSERTYDAPEMELKSEYGAGNSESSGTVNIITPTYLGVMTRFYAGCELSDFDKYMLNLRTGLPVLNVNGIYTEETGFVPETELPAMENEKVRKLLRDYSYVEYSRIYD